MLNEREQLYHRNTTIVEMWSLEYLSTNQRGFGMIDFICKGTVLFICAKYISNQTNVIIYYLWHPSKNFVQKGSKN